MASAPGLRPYLEAAQESERESLEEHKQIVGFADELDGLFRTLATGTSYSEHPAGGLLSLNSHSLFLAAVGAALRGQSPATFTILRGCVESAMYAYLVGKDKNDGDVWLNRRKDPDACKAKFTANRAIQKLESHDPNLAKMARDTYQWMIEFGGHPNPRSVIDHVRLQEIDSDGNQPLSLIYIHGMDSAAFMRALTACIENGCFALGMLLHSVPRHPERDRVFSENWRVFNAFQKHLSDVGYLSDDG